jgi:undecaprenyl-diphosphatase
MWLAWDTAIFRAIHLGLHHPWLDPVMRFLTDPGVFKIPLFVVIGALFLTRRRRGLVGLIVLALTLTVSDQLSSKVLKPVFKRSRPSVVVADSKPLFGVRRSNSFPSGHATNTFAAAPVVSAVFPEATVAAYAAAAVISFSRIYVGDHWPSDVVAGAMLGLCFGLLGRKGFLRLLRTLNVRARTAEEAPSAVPSAPSPAGTRSSNREGTRYTRARPRRDAAGRPLRRARRGPRRADRGRIDRMDGVSRGR